MKKKILIAPNSYKECADSVAAASYFAEEFDKIKSVNKILLPLSDGGDGFLQVCSKYYSLEILEYNISTSYDESTFECRVGYNKVNEIIYIESADVLGLKIIPVEKRHPLYLSSKGLGDLLYNIKEDISHKNLKVKKIIIGIGGTGTNDMGLGALEKFGLKLKDNMGNDLKVIPANYNSTEQIIWNKVDLPFKIEMVSDVGNPLLGENGAALVFGRQKGLTEEEITIADNGFYKIINILNKSKLGGATNDLSGAGGGLPSGLKIFFNAMLKNSKGFILEILSYENLREIDLVITGEGTFDRQSINQKATGYLIDIFKDRKKPVIVCCGKFEGSISSILPENVQIIELRKYFPNEGDSIRYFRKGINFAVKEIAQRYLN